MNAIDLEGRCAVVTGGGAGIGLGIARRLADSGARVAIWDLNEGAARDAAQSLGSEHLGLAVDVGALAGVERATSLTLDAFGQVDVLVCSAGITGPNAKTWEYPPDAWKKVFDINIDGTFFCNRSVIPHMLKRGYGRIVNVASIAGKDGNPNAPAYSASKAAVIGLTKSLGKELATTGISVNCVTPAAVKTAIFDQMSEEHIQFMLSKIPMGRFGEIEEIASMVAWMSSEECSFSTGAVFDLSGGRAVY